MYLIQASKLTKIFLPEFQQACIDDPRIIFNDVPFKVTIPRAFAAIVMEHNKPIHVSNLMAKSKDREIDTDEVRDLLPWLCDYEETDIFGVVRLDVPDMTSQLMGLDLLTEDPKKMEANMKRQADMQKKLMAAMKGAVEKAQEEADSRVKRTLRITHHNLVKQWETNESQGGGKQPPSNAEALGAYILAEEIKRSNAGKQKMVKNLTDIMSSTTVI